MENKITFTIGITLFVLVLIGLSITIYIGPKEDIAIMPIIVITGFFIFLIAAILVGSSLVKMFSPDYNQEKKYK